MPARAAVISAVLSTGDMSDHSLQCHYVCQHSVLSSLSGCQGSSDTGQWSPIPVISYIQRYLGAIEIAQWVNSYCSTMRILIQALKSRVKTQTWLTCTHNPSTVGGGDRRIGGQSPIPEQSMLGQESELFWFETDSPCSLRM